MVKTDIARIDLAKDRIVRTFMNRPLGEADILADRFGVDVYRNGAAVDLTGASVIGYFIRATGDTVVINGGTVSGGNRAYIDLPQACYAYEGQFTLAIKIVKSGITGTMRIIDGTVNRTTTDTVIDPGSVVPDLTALLAQINACEEATAAAEAAAAGMAPAFDVGTANDAGSYVTKDGKLYYLPFGHAENATWANTRKTETKAGSELEKVWAELAAHYDNREAIATEEGYIQNNQSGIDPTEVTISGVWRHAYVTCAEGDVFTINANSTTIPRAYGFFDSSNNALLIAASSTTFTDEVVTAPAGTAYLIINTQGTKASYKNISTKAKISELDSRTAAVENTPQIGSYKFATEEAAVINRVQIDKDENTVTFVVATDSHIWHVGAGFRSLNQCPLIAKVANQVGAKFIVHLGDVSEGGHGTLNANKRDIGKWWSNVGATTVPLLYTIAHHEQYGDGGAAAWGQDASACTRSQCIGMYGKQTKWLDVTWGVDDTCWYTDIGGIRFIGLNSTNSSTYLGFSTDVVNFLSSALNGVNMPVVVFSHAPSKAGVNWNNVGPTGGDAINAVLEAYSGTVIAYIHGHTHWDNIYKYSDLSFPFISVCCVLPQKLQNFESRKCDDGDPTVYDRNAGTWSEYCFDIFNIHTDTGVVKSFRYGAGSDRTYNPNT